MNPRTGHGKDFHDSTPHLPRLPIALSWGLVAALTACSPAPAEPADPIHVDASDPTLTSANLTCHFLSPGGDGEDFIAGLLAYDPHIYERLPLIDWMGHPTDGDGDERVNPDSTPDVLASAAAIHCAHARTMSNARQDGTVTGELVPLTLAAYMFGPGTVLESGGEILYRDPWNRYVANATPHITPGKEPTTR